LATRANGWKVVETLRRLTETTTPRFDLRSGSGGKVSQTESKNRIRSSPPNGGQMAPHVPEKSGLTEDSSWKGALSEANTHRAGNENITAGATTRIAAFRLRLNTPYAMPPGSGA